MTQQFFEHPILNSPYAYPGQHWELDDDGQPTDRILEIRRRSDLTTPVPKPKRRRKGGQIEMVLGSGDGLSTAEQEYNPTPIINEIRTYVEAWRKLPNPNDWQITAWLSSCCWQGDKIRRRHLKFSCSGNAAVIIARRPWPCFAGARTTAQRDVLAAPAEGDLRHHRPGSVPESSMTV